MVSDPDVSDVEKTSLSTSDDDLGVDTGESKAAPGNHQTNSKAPVSTGTNTPITQTWCGHLFRSVSSAALFLTV